MGVEINRLLKQESKNRLNIVLPLEREDKRTKIVEERFSSIIMQDPDLILLDPYLGERLFKVMYTTRNFQQDLKRLPMVHEVLQEQVFEHFEKDFSVFTLNGEERKLNRESGVEIGRNETLRYGFDKVYSVSFGLRTQMLDAVMTDEEHKRHFNEKEIRGAREIFETIESDVNLRFMQDPSIPSGRKQLEREVLTPFHFPFPIKKDERDLPKGIYVNLTGKPSLDEELKEQIIKGIAEYCKSKGIVIYTTKYGKENFDGIDVKVESPSILYNQNIFAHITQLGWGSIIPTIMSKTALIAPPYMYTDDIEKLLNGQLFGKNGLDLIGFYDPRIGDKFSDSLEYALSKTESMQSYLNIIEHHYQTLDGLKYFVAPIIKKQLDTN